MNGITAETTNYYYNGSVLIGMQKGNIVQRFSYDAQGKVVAVDYSTNGGSSYTTYYYLRNAQGDIVKLIDNGGDTKVEYTYDSWGKLISTTGSLATSLGANQPFRYRGYVYDTETQWYYLQSRYYDPNACRFISSDVYLSTGQGVIGHNSYAYCLNNPVARVDLDGQASIAIPGPYNVGLTDTGDRGGGAWTAGGGSTAAGGIDIISTLLFFLAKLIPAPKTQPKVETQEDTQEPPKVTFIYRYGGTNPGNLTPRISDINGLSFSLVPPPNGKAAVTTIEAINATGILMAFNDKGTHVCVVPVGVPMKVWINAGRNSIWTITLKALVAKFGG